MSKMTDKIQRIAIFGNEFQADRAHTMRTVLARLSDHRAVVSVEHGYWASMPAELRADFPQVMPFSSHHFAADYVVSMGGDGTFLKAAALVRGKGCPILGINTGHLGFLADYSPEEAEEGVDALFTGDYRIVTRSTIRAFVYNHNLSTYPYALNEVAVLKRDNASMIQIRASIDGEYLTTYQADGLVVSTPTGSTAYSLSNGGPILAPQTEALTLVPVAPHSLNIRPLVISDKAEVELEVVSRSHNFLLAIDGRSETLAEGALIRLRRAPYDIHIVKRLSKRYFTTLREKMMWGVDKR